MRFVPDAAFSKLSIITLIAESSALNALSALFLRITFLVFWVNKKINKHYVVHTPAQMHFRCHFVARFQKFYVKVR